MLLHFVRVHLENNENRFRQSSLNRVEDAPHLLTPIHELEHSELFSFAETVLREIDVDRHLEDFFESLFCLKDRRGVGLLGDLCVVSRLVMTTRDRVVRADEDDETKGCRPRSRSVFHRERARTI